MLQQSTLILGNLATNANHDLHAIFKCKQSTCNRKQCMISSFVPPNALPITCTRKCLLHTDFKFCVFCMTSRTLSR